MRDHGECDAALDARLLVAHVLGPDASTIVLEAESAVAGNEVARALALAERRIAGEPIARIVGEKEFWSLTFRLSPATLVPRPDSETVVEAALASLRGGRDSPLSILDLGTGSGAILIALLSELPNARGLGVDCSFEAAATARDNAERLGFAGRAAFAVGDWAAALGRRFDLVVANPPYIESAVIPGLPLEVRGHDPHVALDGGADGLGAYRAIVGSLRGFLAPKGLTVLEIGAGQADAVRTIAHVNGFAAETAKDLAGVDRVVLLRRLQGV